MSTNLPDINNRINSKLYVVPPKLQKKPSVAPNQQNNRKIQQNADTEKSIKRVLHDNTQELMRGQPMEVKRAFENLYDQIDMEDSGGITTTEIQSLIEKHTKRKLSVHEISEVLLELDLKGTGDIEFDEFIFVLSQPENYVQLLAVEDLKELSRNASKNTQKIIKKHLIQRAEFKKGEGVTPKTIFFHALRQACQDDSLDALRKFYKNRLRKLNDHVIHDWSAGQRCIGLSDQKMLQRYETIQGELLRQRVNFCKDNSYKQSPYARPLEWGLVTLRQAIKDRQLLKERKQNKPLISQRAVKISDFVVTPKAVPLPKYNVEKRSPLKRTFNYDQLADIREKVDDIATVYYKDLKNVAKDNSKIVKRELLVNEIKKPQSRKNFVLTFKAYCAPFVVSPWIPTPTTTLQASFQPLGKSATAGMKFTRHRHHLRTAT